MSNNLNKNAVPGNEAAFFRLINNPFKFRLFLLQKLPAAYFSGVRLLQANENSASVVVPYKWFTQNPFRSTYFACLGMAAEMSTGVLAMANIYKRRPAVSMLITGIQSKFYKKATGKTIFTCNDGVMIKEIINEALETAEARSITVLSQGKSTSGEIIAEFWVTWSFKAKGVGN